MIIRAVAPIRMTDGDAHVPVTQALIHDLPAKACDGGLDVALDPIVDAILDRRQECSGRSRSARQS
jgi:hypothetical protein